MGPVSPQMRIMRIAVAKAQALPNTIDERLAKIRKASLATQKKSRDSSCGLSVSFCMIIILWFATHKLVLIPVAQGAAERHIRPPATHRPFNDGRSTRARTRPQAGERPHASDHDGQMHCQRPET